MERTSAQGGGTLSAVGFAEANQAHEGQPQDAVSPLPCPFCGDDVASAAFWYCQKPAPPESYHVFCLECEFDGPGGATLEQAIAKWNRRQAAAPGNLQCDWCGELVSGPCNHPGDPCGLYGAAYRKAFP